jgi:hypothetical protein
LYLWQNNGGIRRQLANMTLIVLQCAAQSVTRNESTSIWSSEMKKLAASIAIVAMTATASFAGGPGAVGGEPAVVVNPPAAGSVGSAPIIAVVGGLALICLIACGGSSDDTTAAAAGE